MSKRTVVDFDEWVDGVNFMRVSDSALGILRRQNNDNRRQRDEIVHEFQKRIRDVLKEAEEKIKNEMFISPPETSLLDELDKKMREVDGKDDKVELVLNEGIGKTVIEVMRKIPQTAEDGLFKFILKRISGENKVLAEYEFMEVEEIVRAFKNMEEFMTVTGIDPEDFHIVFWKEEREKLVDYIMNEIKKSL